MSFAFWLLLAICSALFAPSFVLTDAPNHLGSVSDYIANRLLNKLARLKRDSNVHTNGSDLIAPASVLECAYIENGMVSQQKNVLYLLSGSQLFVVNVRPAEKSLSLLATFNAFAERATHFYVSPWQTDSLVVVVGLQTHYDVYYVSTLDDSPIYYPVQKIPIDGKSMKIQMRTDKERLYCILADTVENGRGQISIYDWRNGFFKPVNSVPTIGIDLIDAVFYDNLTLILAINYMADRHEYTSVQVLDGHLNKLQLLHTNSSYVKLMKHNFQPKLITCRPDQCQAHRWHEMHFVEPVPTDLTPSIVEIRSIFRYVLIRSRNNVLHLYDRAEMTYAASVALDEPPDARLKVHPIHSDYNVTYAVVTVKLPDRFKFKFYEIKTVVDPVASAATNGDSDGDDNPFGYIDQCATKLDVEFKRTHAKLIKIEEVLSKIIRNDRPAHLKALIVEGPVDIPRASMVGHLSASFSTLTKQFDALVARIKKLKERLANQKAQPALMDQTLSSGKNEERNLDLEREKDAQRPMIVTRDRVRVKNLITQSPIFKNLLYKSLPNVVEGHLTVKNLVADNIEAVNGRVNDIPLESIYVPGSAQRIGGHKSFRNLTVESVHINGTVNDVPVSQIMPLPAESETVILHSVNCTKLQVTAINGVNFTQFSESVFLRDYPSRNTIAGNLIIQGRVSITNLTTKLLNGMRVDDFFTLSTNQTIERPVEFNRFLAYQLHATKINGINFTEDVVLSGNDNVIETPLQIKSVIVRNKLILSDDENVEMARDIVGTRAEDLSQFYRGPVTIHGNLILGDVTLDHPDNLFIGGERFPLDTIHSYWTKHTLQKFDSASFQGCIKAPQIFVETLNDHPAHKYVTRDQEVITGPIDWHFADVIVTGNVISNESQITRMARKAVRRGDRVVVTGRKHFEHLSTDSLFTTQINDQLIADLHLKASEQISFEGKLTVSDKLFCDNGLEYLSDRLLAVSINHVNVAQLFAAARYIDEPAEFASLEIDRLEVDQLLTVNTFNAIDIAVVRERLQNAKVVVNVKGDAAIERVFAERANGIPVDDYLSLVVKRGDTSLQEWGGNKRFLKGIEVINRFDVKYLSGLDMVHWSENVLQRGVEQEITGHWSFGQVTGTTLYADSTVNGIPVALFIDATADVVINGDLTVNHLVLNSTTVDARSGHNWPLIVARLHQPIHRQWGVINVTANAFIPESNSKLWELISNGVNKLVPQTITGQLVFRGPVHINYLNSNGFKINGIDLGAVMRDTLMDNVVTEYQIVTGAIRFENDLRVRHLRTTNIDVAYINDIDMVAFHDSVWHPSRDPVIPPATLFLGKLIIRNLTVVGPIGQVFIEDLVFDTAMEVKSLQMEQGITVTGDLMIENVNGISIKELLGNRAKLKHSKAQIFTGDITFEDVILEGSSTIYAINSVPIDSLLLSCGDQLQEVTGRKSFKSVHLAGPVHVQTVNDVDLVNLYKSSVVRTENQSLDALNVEQVNVPNGIRITASINGIPMSYFNDPNTTYAHVDEVVAQLRAIISGTNRRKRFTYFDYDQDFELVADSPDETTVLDSYVRPNCTATDKCLCKRETEIRVTNAKKIIRSLSNNTEVLRKTLGDHRLTIYNASFCANEMHVASVVLQLNGHEWSRAINGSILFAELMQVSSNHVYAVIGSQSANGTVQVTVYGRAQDRLLSDTIVVFSNATETHLQTTACGTANLLLAASDHASKTTRSRILRLYKFDEDAHQFRLQHTLNTYYNRIRNVTHAANLCLLVMGRVGIGSVNIYQLRTVGRRFKLRVQQKLVFTAPFMDFTAFVVGEESFIAVALQDGIVRIYKYHHIQDWLEHSSANFGAKLGAIERLVEFRDPQTGGQQHLMIVASEAVQVITVVGSSGSRSSSSSRPDN